ncbi:MAG: histidine phosphatase family protein [Gammaproteobacteria bacterium]|nr:histidine phosphatase family protein [Gammaproteobacteria bacterium]
MRKRHRSLRRKPIFAPLLLPIILFTMVAAGVAWFFDSQATTTIILVRHAEPAGTLSADAPLSMLGQRRAELLARTLVDVDVIRGLDAIYAIPLTVAEQTALPLATMLELPVNPADDSDLGRLMDRVVDDHKGKIVLVVARGEQLPMMSAELGGHKSAPEVGADEYSNIYVLSIPWFGKTKTLRIHYGLELPAEDDLAVAPAN